MINYVGIKKIYDNGTEINVKDLTLYANKIYGLLGPNGAGKTTSIRMMIGLLKPNEGKIYIDDEDISLGVMFKKKIGYVPDHPNLYEYLTGREFIKFIANLYGIVEDEQLNESIDELLKQFEIFDKADEVISSYSKGMKQKISIISALIHKPQILILDEPFTGLDPITIKKLKDYLKEFVRENNKMVIFSSHDLDVVSNLCTDIIIFNRGKVIFNNDIKELKSDLSLEDRFISLLNNSEER